MFDGWARVAADDMKLSLLKEVIAAKPLATVTAVILAGGLGTRLRSVVTDRPKVLIEIRGRPFLAYLFDQLTTVGVRNVVLCTGYLGDEVKAMFGSSYGGLRLVYSQESSPLGTAGALRLALPLLNSDPVLVMNGDSFCWADLSAFWTWHCAKGVGASLLLTKVSDTNRDGRVTIKPNGRVKSFMEKGEASGPGWINGGIYLIKQDLVRAIPLGRTVSIEKEMFPVWIHQGLYGYKSECRFIDIGTPESYALAEQFFTMERSA